MREIRTVQEMHDNDRNKQSHETLQSPLRDNFHAVKFEHMITFREEFREFKTYGKPLERFDPLGLFRDEYLVIETNQNSISLTLQADGPVLWDDGVRAQLLV